MTFKWSSLYATQENLWIMLESGGWVQESHSLEGEECEQTHWFTGK